MALFKKNVYQYSINIFLTNSNNGLSRKLCMWAFFYFCASVCVCVIDTEYIESESERKREFVSKREQI